MSGEYGEYLRRFKRGEWFLCGYNNNGVIIVIALRRLR